MIPAIVGGLEDRIGRQYPDDFARQMLEYADTASLLPTVN